LNNENDVHEIQNNFRNTVNEIKEFFNKNSQMFQTQYIGNNNNEEERNFMQTTEMVKMHTEQMNHILAEMSKSQNTKIEQVLDQFKFMKNEIAEEFDEIKKIKKDKKDKKEKKDKKDKKDKKEKKEEEREDKVEIEIKKPEHKIINQSIQIEKTIDKKKPKYQKKTYYNAGPIESDHSEGENVINTNSSIQMNRRDHMLVSKEIKKEYKKIKKSTLDNSNTNSRGNSKDKDNSKDEIKLIPKQPRIEERNVDVTFNQSQKVETIDHVPENKEISRNFLTSQESIQIENIDRTGKIILNEKMKNMIIDTKSKKMLGIQNLTLSTNATVSEIQISMRIDLTIQLICKLY
jgi:hypothetical protein